VATDPGAHVSVKDEIRRNLIRKIRAEEPLFPGIIGYEDTVIPQLTNAILSRHNFILLGLRGQAKSRILRSLVDLLDEVVPVVPGCEINDDPLAPICAACRARLAEEGDDLRVAWLPRSARYVEKLATPDVTIADIVGDIDPIKAAKSGLHLSSELTMHYGLLPRANRGIFAINELPDLAGKIQVGLFNVLQEGDVQIKGFPVRLPLDVMMVFTANPEDYTARGKIITPLKDRIGSEIRTHYPQTRRHGMAITEQEAWLKRADTECGVEVPEYVREIIEEVAFQAREDKKVDKRSGVSQRLPITCLENVVSNAERRALLNDEALAVPPPCRQLPASSSSSTKASCGARRRSPARSSDRPSRTSSRTCSTGWMATRWWTGSTPAARCCSATARPHLTSSRWRGRFPVSPVSSNTWAFAGKLPGRSSPPPSTSCSKDCTRSRRSAGATSTDTRRRKRPAGRPARRRNRCSTRACRSLGRRSTTTDAMHRTLVDGRW